MLILNSFAALHVQQISNTPVVLHGSAAKNKRLSNRRGGVLAGLSLNQIELYSRYAKKKHISNIIKWMELK